MISSLRKALPARQLPPPPPFWTISNGLDFAFPPVEQVIGGDFIVTATTGRWCVSQTQKGPWNGHLIRHYTDKTYGPIVTRDTAAEVIAETFTVAESRVTAESFRLDQSLV